MTETYDAVCSESGETITIAGETSQYFEVSDMQPTNNLQGGYAVLRAYNAPLMDEIRKNVYVVMPNEIFTFEAENVEPV